MPATDTRIRFGDNDADGLVVDVTTATPASDAAGMVVRPIGTAAVSGTVTIGAALPAGSNAIGSVNADLRVASGAVTNANPVLTNDSLATSIPAQPARKLVPTGTAEVIVGSSTPATQYVRVCGDPSNTAAVYVNGSDVSVTHSIPLYAKDVETKRVSNANLLYCISGTANQYLLIEVL